MNPTKWHSIWHIFWHSFWHPIWYVYNYTYIYILWHSVSILSDIYSDILPGILSNIQHSMWHLFCMAFFPHVFRSVRAQLHPELASVRVHACPDLLLALLTDTTCWQRLSPGRWGITSAVLKILYSSLSSLCTAWVIVIEIAEWVIIESWSS